MEMMLIFLAAIAVTAMVLWKNKTPSDTAALSAPAPMPAAQKSMDQELAARMEEFIKYDRFSLVVQPVVDFAANAATGGEVLSRLNHPERGVIFPDDFLHCVDAAGLYPQFDRYVFQKSCAWLSRSLVAGETVEYISCNFSRKTLSEAEIAMQLTQIADSYGLPHGKLAIEITERERETDAGLLLANLRQLKSDGFRIFLDDYGMGVTSMKDIMNYPLDTVKIDRSILYATNTHQGKAAYRALVAMAKELGLQVVCEGIETEEQGHFAKEAGCRYGQGFLYFRPISTDQVFDMMEKSRIAEEDV